MTTNRPIEEEWRPRGDWRSLLATVVSMFVYAVPWFVFQWRWPIYLQLQAQSLPPLPLTLGLGVVWLVVTIPLLSLVVPIVFTRAGHLEMARRWRRGAIHGAWFGVVVTGVSAGMRLPLSPLLRVFATVALVVAEMSALSWFARRFRDGTDRAPRLHS